MVGQTIVDSSNMNSKAHPGKIKKLEVVLLLTCLQISCAFNASSGYMKEKIYKLLKEIRRQVRALGFVLCCVLIVTIG